MNNAENQPITWITGANGLIGNELLRYSARNLPDRAERGLSRDTVDLLDFAGVTNLFKREKPQLLIHCAAVSRNATCEADPSLARRTNIDVTRHLAELAHAIPFVFFSSDLIFDGAKAPYTDDAPPNPITVYGETKAIAEDEVRHHPQHLIIRISLTGGHSPAGNRAFNEEMKNAWKHGRSMTLFTDEYRCPSAAPVIVRATWELISKGARGTYNLCFSERLSRYDMGTLLAKKHPELRAKIVAGSRLDYKGPPRPGDTSLITSKAQGLFSFKLPRFSEWLEKDDTGF